MVFARELWRKPSAARLSTALVVALLLAACAPGNAEDSARALVRGPHPPYPELARQMRVEGSITLIVCILPDGRVSEVRATSGHPLLAQAAEAAVREWRYASSPLTTTTTVKVDFHLH